MYKTGNDVRAMDCCCLSVVYLYPVWVKYRLIRRSTSYPFPLHILLFHLSYDGRFHNLVDTPVDTTREESSTGDGQEERMKEVASYPNESAVNNALWIIFCCAIIIISRIRYNITLYKREKFHEKVSLKISS